MAVLLVRYWHIGEHPRMMDLINHPIGNNFITRREFLRLSITGITAAFGLITPSMSRLDQFINSFGGHWIRAKNAQEYSNEVLNPDQQGRVLDSSINVYNHPSFKATVVNTYFRDWILPITGITIGTSEDSFNLVWYRVGTEGYSHSGAIQPVLTRKNPVYADIPIDGALAEVTVPYTDARWNPGENELVAYRFYYATTYWVKYLIKDMDGNPWYAVRDDKWEYMHYVPAEHLRIIPHTETQPLSPHIPPHDKHIEVYLPEQVMIAYEYNQPVFMARIASGAIFSNGDFSTPPGRYITFHKRSSRHMARGNLAANGYDLPGVPWNSYITEEGIAFHGTYWHNNFGRPRSHGCINLTPQAAKWLFLWTLPTVPPDQEGIYKDIGTEVDIIG